MKNCRVCKCILDKENSFTNFVKNNALICKPCYSTYRKERLIKAREEIDIEYLFARRLSYTKQRAKTLGVPFNLTVDYLIEILPDKCPVFGTTFDWTGNNRKLSPSIDRKVPEKGYVIGNVEIISFRANIMKNDATKEELNAFAKWIMRI